jgi:hypothetical protein
MSDNFINKKAIYDEATPNNFYGTQCQLEHFESPCTCNSTDRKLFDEHKEEYLRAWSLISQIPLILRLDLRSYRKFGYIDDRELEKLNGLPQLKNLSIFRMPITGSGFATVTKLKDLQHISIQEVKLFDEFLNGRRIFLRWYR